MVAHVRQGTKRQLKHQTAKWGAAKADKCLNRVLVQLPMGLTSGCCYSLIDTLAVLLASQHREYCS